MSSSRFDTLSLRLCTHSYDRYTYTHMSEERQTEVDQSTFRHRRRRTGLHYTISLFFRVCTHKCSHIRCLLLAHVAKRAPFFTKKVLEKASSPEQIPIEKVCLVSSDRERLSPQCSILVSRTPPLGSAAVFELFAPEGDRT